MTKRQPKNENEAIHFQVTHDLRRNNNEKRARVWNAERKIVYRNIEWGIACKICKQNPDYIMEALR